MAKLSNALEARVKALVEGKAGEEAVRPDIKVMARSYLGHLNKAKPNIMAEVSTSILLALALPVLVLTAMLP